MDVGDPRIDHRPQIDHQLKGGGMLAEVFRWILQSIYNWPLEILVQKAIHFI